MGTAGCCKFTWVARNERISHQAHKSADPILPSLNQITININATFGEYQNINKTLYFTSYIFIS